MLQQEQLSSWPEHPRCFPESFQGLWEDAEAESIHHRIK